MDKNEIEQEMFLHGLSDEAEEIIAEEYPALDDDALKRIMQKCGLDDLNDIEITVTENEMKDDIDDTVEGTEIYCRPVWHRFAAVAAAFVIVAMGIGGAVMLGRNGSQPPMDPSGKVAFSGATKPDGAVISAETEVEEATEEITTAQPVVTAVPVVTTPVVTVTTAVPTTVATTTTVTTTDIENTEPASTEAATETVTTTAPAAEADQPEPIRRPTGYWISESGGNKRYWNFHADGSGGMFVNAESGIGLGFILDVEDGDLVFHIASVDDVTPASITWLDEESFALTWTETGLTETFSPDPEAHINDF